MSSALVSNLHHQQLPHFPKIWGTAREGYPRETHCSHTPPLLINGAFRSTQASPLQARQDSWGKTGSPLINPYSEAQSFQRLPATASNPPPFVATQAPSDNTMVSNSRQAFYNFYASANQPPSPAISHNDRVAQSERTARRRASSDGNSIASHLQIPPSINDSKGSLPEFAAQVHTESSLVDFLCCL